MKTKRIFYLKNMRYKKFIIGVALHNRNRFVFSTYKFQKLLGIMPVLKSYSKRNC